MDENAIRVRGLHKRHPGAVRPAADGVDLDVRRGEVFVLLGGPGSGTTAIVEILQGYGRRDGGEVSVLGADPGRGGPEWPARIALVLQRDGGLGGLRARDVVVQVAGYYPEPHDPDDVLRLVGLWDDRHALVHTLSAGQRSRLDLALGVVGRPEVLFLDAVDIAGGLRRFVRALAAAGTTVVLTTSCVEEAAALADHLVVIADGRVVAEGAPAVLDDRDVRAAAAGGPARSCTRAALVGVRAADLGGSAPGLLVTRPGRDDVHLRLISDVPPHPPDQPRGRGTARPAAGVR